MRRDVDLIRRILSYVEETKIVYGSEFKPIPGYTKEQTDYHAELVVEAGLAEGQAIRGSNGDLVRVLIFKLTWAGHDFLDVSRSDEVWNKVRRKIASTGGAWTLEIVKTLCIATVKAHLQIAPD